MEEGAAELVVEPTTHAPAPGRANVDGAATMQEGAEKEYNFVIKSPPKMSFIRMVHKLSRPFFNEVSWYLDLVRGENKNKSSVDDMSESDSVASRIVILSNPCNKMCFGGCFRRLAWEFNISALILIFFEEVFYSFKMCFAFKVPQGKIKPSYQLIWTKVTVLCLA